MAHIYEKAFFADKIVPFGDAKLSIASSAVLYGLSVYTVFHVRLTEQGDMLAFRIKDHYKRLIDSARIIGINTFEDQWDFEKFFEAVKQVAAANDFKGDVFMRVSVHVDELLPGTRSRGVSSVLSIFAYEAQAIVPRTGARLKTSVWRRIPDYAIPSRAKVNGAYVNSVLARQDAIDSGYDDCVFLDVSGHVCELSAANIFVVRNGVLMTPDTHSDLLEGINRRSVLTVAKDAGITVLEKTIDLTELYIADEIFICGTSAFITPVFEVDSRKIGDGKIGEITQKVQKLHADALTGQADQYKQWTTRIN